MTPPISCDGIRVALGVYVVGAIDPAERTIVEAHLNHCLDCREELAALAGLPALLGRVPLEDAERLALSGATVRDLQEPPAELLNSLLGRVAARRSARRWRMVTGAAAAAVIAVASGLAGGAALSDGTHRPATAVGPSAGSVTYQTVARGTDARTHVAATVAYSPAAWGTALSAQVTGVRAPTTCKLWVVDSRGRWLAAGGWTVVAGHEDQWYLSSSSVNGSDIRSFAITAGNQVLVTIPAT